MCISLVLTRPRSGASISDESEQTCAQPNAHCQPVPLGPWRCHQVGEGPLEGTAFQSATWLSPPPHPTRLPCEEHPGPPRRRRAARSPCLSIPRPDRPRRPPALQPRLPEGPQALLRLSGKLMARGTQRPQAERPPCACPSSKCTSTSLGSTVLARSQAPSPRGSVFATPRAGAQ